MCTRAVTDGANAHTSVRIHGLQAPAVTCNVYCVCVLQLTRDDIKQCKEEALRTVKVPSSVIQMVTDLRTYLQEKIEPPVYVSDRRLVKSVQLLQVRYDTLLLMHTNGLQTPAVPSRRSTLVPFSLGVPKQLARAGVWVGNYQPRTCVCMCVSSGGCIL